MMAEDGRKGGTGMDEEKEGHWIERVHPSFYDMVERAGLGHLLDRPEELRAEVLRRLGMLHLKDDPEGMMKAMVQKVDDNLLKLRRVRRQIDEQVVRAYRVSSN
jgi:hypothetical protein